MHVFMSDVKGRIYLCNLITRNERYGYCEVAHCRGQEWRKLCGLSIINEGFCLGGGPGSESLKFTHL